MRYLRRGRSNCNERKVAFCRNVVAMAMTVFKGKPHARRDSVCRERLERTALAMAMPAPRIKGLWLRVGKKNEEEVSDEREEFVVPSSGQIPEVECLEVTILALQPQVAHVFALDVVALEVEGPQRGADAPRRPLDQFLANEGEAVVRDAVVAQRQRPQKHVVPVGLRQGLDEDGHVGVREPEGGRPGERQHLDDGVVPGAVAACNRGDDGRLEQRGRGYRGRGNRVVQRVE